MAESSTIALTGLAGVLSGIVGAADRKLAQEKESAAKKSRDIDDRIKLQGLRHKSIKAALLKAHGASKAKAELANTQSQTGLREAQAQEATASGQLKTEQAGLFQQLGQQGQSPSGGLQVTGANIGGIKLEDQQAQARGAGLQERARIAERPLPASVQQKVGSLINVTRNLKQALKLYKPEFVGKGFQGTPGGLIAGIKEFSGDISGEQVVFRKALKSAEEDLLRAKSGAQINEAEFKRIKALFPGENDEPNVFIPALMRAISEMEAVAKDKIRLASTPASQLGTSGGTQSGPTATNPQTGEKVRFDGTKWVPIQ